MDSHDPLLRRGFLGGWALAAAAAAPTPGASSRTLFNIRDFGARGDKTTNETPSVQAAIDACHAAGGGVVYAPPGDYLSGSLFLKSRVTLYLEAGATLYASTKQQDYAPSAHQLITARNAEFISILGPGVLHGGGTADLGRRPGYATEPRPAFRTQVLYLEECRQVSLRDFTILYSDSWACHLRRCERVVIDGVTIFNNYFRTNSDGIDPESCKDVRIANCHITAGDDCICLKTHGGIPCEDIAVTNCTTESIATAIKLGTGSEGDFRNVTISNCTVRNSTVGVGFFIKDGGTIHDVTVSNLTIETLRDPMLVNPERLRNMIYPVFLDVEKRHDASPAGAMRDIIFDNILIRADNGILVQGMRESAIENLLLRNIVFRATRAFDYSQRQKHAGGASNPKDDRITLYARQPSYCTVANVRNLSVDHLSVVAEPDVLDAHPRTALSIFNAEGASLRSIHRSASERAGPVVELNHCREVLITGCLAPAKTGVFARARNMGKGDCALAGNDLSRAGKDVDWQ